ncbi:probable histone-lysine N-methyltransferase set-23 [Condylostylus longicornis]|uniref:probable histone-lysine N-methyltransferase set-23 n=1 Tax=Condylostylus longicornis TaxID=2530218 RepID=UPI00244E26D2|nr:probable histone-lysine N-methyltransferase set-23 [Condylostylus longicornis]
MARKFIFEDEYLHNDFTLEYCYENVLHNPIGLKTEEFLNLKCLFNSFLINNCICKQDCLQNCGHSQNYLFSEEYDELLLNKDRVSRDIIYECSENCQCSSDCGNRLVQYGPRAGLIVKPSKIISNEEGLFTSNCIPVGGFICEYAGEILTRSEALKRDRYQESNRILNKLGQQIFKNYIICLKEKRLQCENGEVLETFIDPSKVGNIGRYINHSCDPNCDIISVRIDCPIPKLAVFAKRNIKAMEELFFDYGEGFINEDSSFSPVKCLCNTEKCRKILPAFCY